MFRHFIRKVKEFKTPEDLKSYLDEEKMNTESKSTLKRLIDVCITNIPKTNESNIIEMYGMLNTVVPILTGDSGVQIAFLKIRKQLKKRFQEGSEVLKKSYTLMRFDQEKWRANREKYNEKVFNNNNQKIQIPEELIHSIVEKLKISDSPIDKAILLQLACGGRSVEILSYSNYSRSEIQNNIIQHRFAKQKGEKADHRTEVDKPLLFLTQSEFLKILQEMRTKIEDDKKSSYEIAQLYNTPINNRIRELFKLPLHSHDMRKLYANIAYTTRCNKSKQSEQAYINHILGHAPQSFEVAKCYSTISVVPVEAPIQIEQKASIEEKKAPIQIEQKEEKKEIEIPTNNKRRDGNSFERMMITIEALKANNISITARKLKAYGYGSRTIQMYKSP